MIFLGCGVVNIMTELPIIHDCFWNSLVINIDYHCDCVAMISLEVFRSGQTFMHVEVAYEDGGVFHVKAPTVTSLSTSLTSQLGRFDGHPLVCGFFKSGRTCMAGATCPFAHKVPRVFDSRTGLDNPKTVELLARNVYMGPVDPPLDQTLKTLYLRRLNSSVHEQHIRDRFNPYGEIESIVYFAMRGVDGAFLTYTTREGAEKAMLEHSSWVVINGQNVKLLWGAHVIPKEAVVQENDQPQDHDRDHLSYSFLSHVAGLQGVGKTTVWELTCYLKK
ncbi:hypothetical protein IGI04_041994, partial [Brassica rapa subsp. trilocularis]